MIDILSCNSENGRDTKRGHWTSNLIQNNVLVTS